MEHRPFEGVHIQNTPKMLSKLTKIVIFDSGKQEWHQKNSEGKSVFDLFW